MSGTIYATKVLDYFDSGAGPIPGPYGIPTLGDNAQPVDPGIVVDADPATGALSLPTGSYVTVGFSNALIVDRPGDDLAVEELDPAGESAAVYASSDGTLFFPLGIAGVGTTGFDLATAGFSGPVQAVKVVGLDLGGASPGFDVLNVQALQATTELDLGFGGNLVALDPVWDRETQTLRYGFEVQSGLFGLGDPSDEEVQAAAAIVDVKVSLGTQIFFSGQNLGLELSALSQGPSVEDNRVVYSLPVASIPFALSDDDLRRDSLVAVVDPDDRVGEWTNADNQGIIDFPFVRKIPQIMRNIAEEWSVPAEFQERWLENKGNVIEGTIDDAASNPDLATQPVALGWVLQDSVDTNNRAQEAFDRLTDVDYLFTENSTALLADRLTERLGSAPVGTVIEYGVEDYTLRGLNDSYIQNSPVSTGTTIDPLTGALGNFSFYAVPVGRVEKTSDTSYQFTATGVGVYAADIFEFNGFQYLGSWGPPNDVSLVPQSPSYVPVFNSTYQDYRYETGLGEDFVVLSDVAFEDLRNDAGPVTSIAFPVEV